MNESTRGIRRQSPSSCRSHRAAPPFRGIRPRSPSPGRLFRFAHRAFRSGILLLVLLLVPAAGHATWSVIAVDQRTGMVVIASATCVSQQALLRFPSRGLMDIQAIVVPGVGVAAAQAGVDRSRENQRLIHRELREGTHPDQILEMLREDPRIESRQFAIVDLRGRSAGFSGSGNSPASLSVQGAVPGRPEGEGIFFAVQGNILASDDVVHRAVEAFLGEGTAPAEPDLLDRVMAAMEAADAAGGDRRCTCETQPVPDAPCDGRTSHVAYLLAADPADAEGEGFNDGDWSLVIDVHNQNIGPDENANPVITLRRRYDAWRAREGERER